MRSGYGRFSKHAVEINLPFLTTLTSRLSVERGARPRTAALRARSNASQQLRRSVLQNVPSRDRKRIPAGCAAVFLDMFKSSFRTEEYFMGRAVFRMPVVGGVFMVDGRRIKG
jgi:hypothetical protein